MKCRPSPPENPGPTDSAIRPVLAGNQKHEDCDSHKHDPTKQTIRKSVGPSNRGVPSVRPNDSEWPATGQFACPIIPFLRFPVNLLLTFESQLLKFPKEFLANGFILLVSHLLKQAFHPFFCGFFLQRLLVRLLFWCLLVVVADRKSRVVRVGFGGRWLFRPDQWPTAGRSHGARQ